MKLNSLFWIKYLQVNKQKQIKAKIKLIIFKEIGKKDNDNNTFKFIIRLKVDISKTENLFLLNIFDPDTFRGTKHKNENIKKNANI